MKDKENFTIYSESSSTLSGRISEGCLHLEFVVFGDYDSEKYYDFSKKDTKKLFKIIGFDDFLESCREGRLLWLEDFLAKNGIEPKTFCH
jgi:hypothetical protein